LHIRDLLEGVLVVPAPSYNRLTVPLSDHEQRILDEIEKNLLQEDPAFARQVKERAEHRDGRSRIRIGSLSFVAGFVGLFIFFASTVVVVGVVAFAAMVLGIVLIAGGVRSLASGRELLSSPKERIGTIFSRWEERVRDRYKNDE
jgi:hypothetical protein